ncbi:MAG: type 2 isopentenyl-diphosphate Delta-isomerase [Candidatus Njordarchaeales archaeon]
MTFLDKKIINRKDEHIYLTLNTDVAHKETTWFECIKLIHKALPELSLENIQLKTVFLGKTFSYPFLIEGMTGGTELGANINRNLAEAAEELNIPMMVGSQRVALKNPEVEWTFKIARKTAPDIFLIANIGAPQLPELSINDLEKIVSMIEANALAIHLNPLQEVIQPEGDTNYRGVLEKISEIADYFDIPLIVKETGSGISKEVARSLSNTGIKAIDVAGVGGTSWAAVEYYRARKSRDDLRTRLGEIFWSWGIPTAASIIEARNGASADLEIIASGGIRSGLDIAKALAIGANFSGAAKPLLEPAMKSADDVKKVIEEMMYELRIAMFLCGAKTINDLKNIEFVILPPLRYWIIDRGLEIKRGV